MKLVNFHASKSFCITNCDSQSVLIGENVPEKLVKMLKSIYDTESDLYAQIDCIQTINEHP